MKPCMKVVSQLSLYGDRRVIPSTLYLEMLGFMKRWLYVEKHPVCDSNQKSHFKNKYIYIRIMIFFKRCIQHLAAGAAVIFLL